MMHVVLYQPQIPQNTGNIVRTCACTGASLILVPPLGFKISNRHLKRAGLDYWEGVHVTQENEFDTFLLSLQKPFYFFSSHATKKYSSLKFTPHDYLIFGSETSGLPAYLHEKWGHLFYTIPMRQGVRCLNLATSVGIVLYEAYRQLNFENL